MSPNHSDLLLRCNRLLIVCGQRNNHRRIRANADLDLLGTLFLGTPNDLLDFTLPYTRRLVAHLIAPNVPIRWKMYLSCPEEKRFPNQADTIDESGGIRVVNSRAIAKNDFLLDASRSGTACPHHWRLVADRGPQLAASRRRGRSTNYKRALS